MTTCAGKPATVPDAIRRWIEVIGIGTIVAGYVVAQRSIAARWYFVIPALALGGSYLLLRLRQRGGTWRDFGITTRNLGPSMRWSAAIVIATLVFGLAVTWRSEQPIPRSFWILLAAYPIWGVAQQFMFQGVFHENLLRLGLPVVVTVPATTALFVLVHYPSVNLMRYSAVGGLVLGVLYWRYRNLLPLGIAHGICGAIIYHLVLHRDPLQRFLGP